MVAICAVFFSLGYAVGKGSSTANAQVITDSSELSAIASTGGAKPTPARTPPPAEPTAEAAEPAATSPDSKAQGTSGSQPEAASAHKSEPSSSPAESAAKTATPELSKTPSTGFMVQVAAVSKQEDAEALVSALRKKQYPVLVVNNVPNSPYYHVQVGPFSQQKDAEAMRTKLASDGYNAILKK